MKEALKKHKKVVVFVAAIIIIIICCIAVHISDKRSPFPASAV